MEHEFHEDGPLLPQPDDGEEKTVEDLEWDICPKLLRWKRRQFIRMLRKYLKVFVGKEKWLGKVLSKYIMDIDADPSEIKTQQPYRTSPRKCRLIKEVIDSLKDLDIIQPSSKVNSPIILVIQKGKPRFCVDLREVNWKKKPDRYALPHQDSIFRALASFGLLSALNCNHGYKL